MAETEQHERYDQGWQSVDGVPREEPDWRTIDRLIVLMSLTVTKRMLRRRGKKMPDRVRAMLLDRIGKLIEFYKQPRRG